MHILILGTTVSISRSLPPFCSFSRDCGASVATSRSCPC